MPQHEIVTPGPLLDERGLLRQAGWSRRPWLAYERSAVAAPARRIKEWDYYCSLGSNFGVALTIADIGYAGLVSATVIDLASGTETTASRLVPFTLGSFGLAAHSGKSDVKIRLKNFSMDFAVLEGSRLLRMDIPNFNHGIGLRGALVLTAKPFTDSIVTAIPWSNKPKLFFYNQKINCFDVEGVVQHGNTKMIFHKNEAFACLNWGRGVWPYQAAWYWASASGLVDGKSIGFNFGYGIGDNSDGIENGLFYDGQLQKLGQVAIQMTSRDYLADWQFRDAEGRVDLVLKPVLDRQATTRILIYSSVQHQIFGRFSGRLRLENGQDLKIVDLPGFIERVKNRW